MKLVWIGKWKKGQLSVEAENLQELVGALNELEKCGELESVPIQELEEPPFPKIKEDASCSETIIQILGSEWGKVKLRNWLEIHEVLKNNARYYTTGAITGALNYLTKNKRVRREKIGNKYSYAVI